MKYTPIKCQKTKIPLELGDFVQDPQGRNGTLEWDDYFNQYYIKPKNGGKIKTQTYTKVEVLNDVKVDNTRVECRKNHLKKKW